MPTNVSAVRLESKRAFKAMPRWVLIRQLAGALTAVKFKFFIVLIR